MKFTDRVLMLLGRRRAYGQCFLDESGQLTPAASAVLADLARFCRVHQSTAIVSPISRTIDTHASFMAEGRREVYNRVIAILRVTDEQILASTREKQEENDE